MTCHTGSDEVSNSYVKAYPMQLGKESTIKTTALQQHQQKGYTMF